MKRHSHLRAASATPDHRVSNLELFFDLVFVFAVTQLSHYLLEHHGLAGALQTLVMFLAVWWSWVYTAWATNWLDPERPGVRIALILVMLAGLVMSTSIPRAFGSMGLAFALAYVTIQVGRTAYTAWAREWGESWNMARACLYFVASGVPWILGGLDPDPMRRMLWWAGALAIEFAGPLTFFWIPGLGRSKVEDWDISGAHMAERCSLFIIICLGESVLVTGATIAGMEPDAHSIAGFVSAFVGSVAMWWIYFDVGARRGTELIEHDEAPGLIAREAYTYAHIPIVAGIIILAVADELVISHPTGHLDPFLVACLMTGAFLFIGGTMFFKRFSSELHRFPLSHLAGLGLFALLGAWATTAHPQPLTVHAAASAILVVIAVWEWGSFHGGWLERWRRLRG